MKQFPILFSVLMTVCIGLIAGFLFLISPDSVVKSPNLKPFLISDDTTVQMPEIRDEELEGEGQTYDTSQIYFMAIEPLYEVYSFDEMERIKAKVTSFVHTTIDPNILDLLILKDSLITTDTKTSFHIQLESGEHFEISTASGKPMKIVISSVKTNK